MTTPRTPKKAHKNQAVHAPRNFEAPSTTGHSWDGIEEYNNPLPRWWVWTFFACVAFAVGYVLYYPAFPGVHESASHWTALKQLNQDIAEAQLAKKGFDDKLAATGLSDVEKDDSLRNYAQAAGKMLFAINCSQCHGAGGAGSKGFPNLLDDEWLHGGKLADIAFTITHGIRNSQDPLARNPGLMPAFGKDEILTSGQVADVVNYLSVLSHGAKPNESTERGAQVFKENCTACHGLNGEGNREFGAPSLNNAIWLYGGDNASRMETLTNGRGGVMPAWGLRLSELDIKKLAIYVHNLGGGEADSSEDSGMKANMTVSATDIPAKILPYVTSGSTPAINPTPAPSPTVPAGK
jgi:cytochrome c oxidase cbb3-type subunit 3